MTSSIRGCAYTAYHAVTSPSDKDEWSTVKRKMQRGGRLLGTTMVVSLLFAALGSASGGVSGAATLSIRHANGTPILIGSEAPLTNPAISFPEVKSGMQAAVASINAAGGVKGHPLQLDFCDTQLTANGELSCARKLIADHVVAVIDATIVEDQSGAEFNLFSSAGIPYFAGEGVSPAELTSPNSYPLASGAPGWFYGTIQVLKKAGATKFGIYAGANIAPEQYAVSQVEAAMTGLGIPASHYVVVYGDPTSDPTLAASAAKVTSGGVNGIIMLPVDPVLMVKALRSTAYKGALSSISSSIEVALPQMGSSANGVLISSQTAFASHNSSSAAAKFRADMKHYVPSGTVDLNSLGAYAAVELFRSVADTSTAKTLTSAAFKTAANKISTPINLGLIGPWAIKGRTPALPGEPRLLNPNIAYGVVKNGQIVPEGSVGFSNPFKTTASS